MGEIAIIVLLSSALTLSVENATYFSITWHHFYTFNLFNPIDLE